MKAKQMIILIMGTLVSLNLLAAPPANLGNIDPADPKPTNRFSTSDSYFTLNQEYIMNMRAGKRLPSYPTDANFVNNCLQMFKTPSTFKVKRIGFIKEIDKDDKIKLRKKPTNDDFDIIAYDLTADLNYEGISQKATYRFYYYRSKLKFNYSSDKNPLVIVSPSIKGIKASGIRAIETKWTKEFAKNGINSLIMSLDEDLLDPNRPLGMMDRWLAKQVIGMRLMLNFVERDLSEEVDVDKMGAIGASLGGIRTAIFMGVEPTRIKSGILIAAGGNFPDLWTASEQKYVEQYRNYRMTVEKVPGWNEEEKLEYVYNYVKARTCTDPIIFTGRRPFFSDDVQVYIGTKDKKVPTKNQLELWAAMGKPKRVKGHAKHRGVIYASANGFREDLARFFNMKFRN